MPRARGAVLFVPPFAEELNKSRHVVAAQARALAAAGYDVLQFDLYGCGDSSGDLQDADWAVWCDDVLAAYRSLRSRSQAPLTLWGVRAGCLLAADAGSCLPEAVSYLFWQPVLSGKLHFQQFLRLKMAAELASGQSKGVTEGLKRDLAAGRPIEVAGYTISPALAAGLESANLDVATGRCAWMEVSSRDDAALAPVSANRVAEWEKRGVDVSFSVVKAPAFWQTTELEEAPALIDTTCRVLATWS